MCFVKNATLLWLRNECMAQIPLADNTPASQLIINSFFPPHANWCWAAGREVAWVTVRSMDALSHPLVFVGKSEFLPNQPSNDWGKSPEKEWNVGRDGRANSSAGQSHQYQPERPWEACPVNVFYSYFVCFFYTLRKKICQTHIHLQKKYKYVFCFFFLFFTYEYVWKFIWMFTFLEEFLYPPTMLCSKTKQCNSTLTFPKSKFSVVESKNRQVFANLLLERRRRTTKSEPSARKTWYNRLHAGRERLWRFTARPCKNVSCKMWGNVHVRHTALKR